MVAFPVHLPATVTLGRGPCNGVEVGEGDLEVRVGFDSEVEGHGGLVPVYRSLCLAVAGRGRQAGGDGAAVVLGSRPDRLQLIMLAYRLTLFAGGLTLFGVHEARLPWWPEAALM